MINCRYVDFQRKSKQIDNQSFIIEPYNIYFNKMSEKIKVPLILEFILRVVDYVN
jgi:hypothetical protein